MATKQFLIRPDEAFIGRLEKAADRFGVRTANQLALEVLEKYFELYCQAKQAEQDTRNAQFEAALGKAKASSTTAPMGARRKAS
jgi:hypothetical protein